jgi:hypothetical protein
MKKIPFCSLFPACLLYAVDQQHTAHKQKAFIAFIKQSPEALTGELRTWNPVSTIKPESKALG